MNNQDKKIIETAALLSSDDINLDIIQRAARTMLVAFGENVEREGLLRTPERVARMYEELLSGYRADPIAILNEALFEVDYDETVLIRDIEFFSLCEHHMLPFMGRVHVAYIPDGKVIGLSKIPRIVDMFSHRLQVQERMTKQIGDFINLVLQPKGVAVVVEAIHLCSMMRGVKKHDARMTTSAMLGAFRTDAAQRMEFLENISRSAEPLQV
jgi:GTP cyclohydrolase I